MLVLGDLTEVAGHQEEEERSQMIGRDPKTAFSYYLLPPLSGSK